MLRHIVRYKYEYRHIWVYKEWANITTHTIIQTDICKYKCKYYHTHTHLHTYVPWYTSFGAWLILKKNIQHFIIWFYIFFTNANTNNLRWKKGKKKIKIYLLQIKRENTNLFWLTKKANTNIYIQTNIRYTLDSFNLFLLFCIT